jgi:hypothetical protein
VGLVAGAVGGIVTAVVPAGPRALAVAALGALVLLREASGRPWRRLQNRRLVPPEIIPRGQVEGPLQFGFEMGTGMRTFSPSALPHLLLAVVVLTGGLAEGLVAGLGFALGRSLVPWVRSVGGRLDWDARLRRSSAWLLRVSALAFLGALVASGALAG